MKTCNHDYIRYYNQGLMIPEITACKHCRETKPTLEQLSEYPAEIIKRIKMYFVIRGDL